MNSNAAPTPLKPAHANYTFATIEPRLIGQRCLGTYAYAANGNLHNPTPGYRWLLLRDGTRIVDTFRRRSDLLAAVSQFGVDYLDD
jgi:hypothetical protein